MKRYLPVAFVPLLLLSNLLQPVKAQLTVSGAGERLSAPDTTGVDSLLHLTETAPDPLLLPVTTAAPDTTLADSLAADTTLTIIPPVIPPPLDSLLRSESTTRAAFPLDSLLMYHAAANWYDLSSRVPGVQTLGSGYTGHPLYLVSGGVPSYILPVSRDGVELNNPASGLYNLNQLGFYRGAVAETADGLALFSPLPEPDTVMTDLDYRQAFYGNNRIFFRTQHPLPGGFVQGETRQQFFKGKMANGEARENCTSLALYRYLFLRSWLVVQLDHNRHYNGVWQSASATLQRETHQRFALQLPGVSGSWQWLPLFSYSRDHLYEESPYNSGLETKSWLGSLKLAKSFSATHRVEFRAGLDLTEAIAESYRLNRRLGLGELSWHYRLPSGWLWQSRLELLQEDERDTRAQSWSLSTMLPLTAGLNWQLELARHESLLPFNFQRGGAEVIAQYELLYPRLRSETLTTFRPDPEAVTTTRLGGRTSLSYHHPEGHSATLTGRVWDFEDYPFLQVLDDTTVIVRQRGNQLFGEELKLQLKLPWQLRWFTVQSWQRDSEGLVSSELPTISVSSELRWSRLFYDGHLHFNATIGLTSAWGAVRQDGEPLSDHLLPYLHLAARQGNFILYWSLHNPLSFENYAMEGIPGMHRDEVIGVMWRLLN